MEITGRRPTEVRPAAGRNVQFTKENVMRVSIYATMLLTVFGFGLAGCQTAPATEAKRDTLDSDVQRGLDNMRSEDPSFGRFLDDAYAYAVYPTVGKGGLIAGGAYGKGEVYEQGKMIGYSDLTQVTVGAQIGGQSYSEVVVFQNKAALDKFIAKEYAFDAAVSAVALKSGAAKTARFQDGVAVFKYIKGGLMAEASVGGQRFRFTPIR
jgi:lipid-binding SYLF domain-containing protein